MYVHQLYQDTHRTTTEHPPVVLLIPNLFTDRETLSLEGLSGLSGGGSHGPAHAGRKCLAGVE